jgi:hypothetical protein
MAQPGRAGRQPVGPLTEVLRPFRNILRKLGMAWGTATIERCYTLTSRRACAGRDCGVEWSDGSIVPEMPVV